MSSGHILGSAFVALKTPRTSLLFSGDLGRPHDLVMSAPSRIEKVDYLVVESTYGDRRSRYPSPQSVCTRSTQHHLVYRLSSQRDTGASLVNGAETIKIHGEYIPVRAEVRMLENLSAHADADEIFGWLKGHTQPPRRTFITLASLRRRMHCAIVSKKNCIGRVSYLNTSNA